MVWCQTGDNLEANQEPVRCRIISLTWLVILTYEGFSRFYAGLIVAYVRLHLLTMMGDGGRGTGDGDGDGEGEEEEEEDDDDHDDDDDDDEDDIKTRMCCQ